MNIMATLLLLFLLSGCNSLRIHDYDSTSTATAKGAARVVQCVLTICISELSYAELDAKAEQRAAYAQWYYSLPSEDRAIEDRRELARTYAAGMILQGYALRPLIPTMQPYNQPPLPAFVPSPLPRIFPPVSCSTNVVGGYAQTDCY